MQFLLLFIVYIAGLTLAHPVVDIKPECTNCIKMTKQAEAEIEDMITEIGDFIMDLLQVHHRFHMKHAKFEIEHHSKDNPEKEVLFQITINDCPDSSPENDREEEKTTNNEKQQNNKEQIPSVNEETKGHEKQNDVSKKPVKPEIMTLDLDEVGLDLMKRLDEKRGNTPLVVYVQKSEKGHMGQEKVIFLNRK